MNREQFLKSALATGLAVSVPESLIELAGDEFGISGGLQASGRTNLVVARGVRTGATPARITAAAINALGGMRRFISRGDVVVIKPNIGWDRRPEFAANTNPQVVSALVRMCFDAGARRVKIFDRPVNDPRRCYRNSGIAAAARAAGAEVSFMNPRGFRDMRINGEALRTWPLYTEVFEADKVINVPIAKHHSLARLTLAMKNWMGIMGGRRGWIHININTKLADVARVVRPALTVLDAVRILVRHGPSGGRLADVRTLNTIVASTDQVAVDAYGATLFGMRGSDLGYVRIAARARLGEMNLSRMNIRRVNV